MSKFAHMKEGNNGYIIRVEHGPGFRFYKFTDATEAFRFLASFFDEKCIVIPGGYHDVEEFYLDEPATKAIEEGQ